jgi:hypothetical protein
MADTVVEAALIPRAVTIEVAPKPMKTILAPITNVMVFVGVSHGTSAMSLTFLIGMSKVASLLPELLSHQGEILEGIMRIPWEWFMFTLTLV